MRNVIMPVEDVMMEDQRTAYHAIKDTGTILLLIFVYLVKKYLDISLMKKKNARKSVEMEF